MKTNFYGFLTALLLNATIVFAIPGVNPFTSSDISISAKMLKASVNGLQCTSTDTRSQLTWSVSNNELAGQLELERSVKGAAFKTIAIIFPGEQKGNAEYAYRDNSVSTSTMYRVKIVENSGKATYSTVVSR